MVGPLGMRCLFTTGQFRKELCSDGHSKGCDMTEAAEQNLAVAQSYRGLKAFNAVTHY